jgi:HD superfamily phosphodiesterase
MKLPLTTLAPLINFSFNYVAKITNMYKLDESHALKHSMDVFHIANKIYDSEIEYNPFLENQKDVIFVSAIVHDTCDKKYMNEKNGVGLIKNYLADYMSATNLDTVCNIVSTMSYSKVQICGYPDLGEYQLAYHIVREADLLSAYDIDRCIIYGMYKENLSYVDALKRAIELFQTRILKYREQELFITNYSKRESFFLHNNALETINVLRNNLQ